MYRYNAKHLNTLTMEKERKRKGKKKKYITFHFHSFINIANNKTAAI